MKIDRHGIVQVEKIRQKPVGQLRGENLHEAHGADVTVHAKGAPVPKIEAGGGDGVLGAVAGFGDIPPVEAKFLLPVRVELPMQNLQSLQPSQRAGGDTQRFEARKDIRLNPLQPGLGGF